MDVEIFESAKKNLGNQKSLYTCRRERDKAIATPIYNSVHWNITGFVQRLSIVTQYCITDHHLICDDEVLHNSRPRFQSLSRESSPNNQALITEETRIVDR